MNDIPNTNCLMKDTSLTWNIQINNIKDTITSRNNKFLKGGEKNLKKSSD